MIRSDGLYVIYRIQYLKGNDLPDSLNDEDDWSYPNFDYFGTPVGFGANHECWQQTGVHGTYSQVIAKAGLEWISKKWTDHKWRVVRVVISQTTLTDFEL